MIRSIYNSRIGINCIAYVLLGIIAFIDHITGYEISSSILYLVPIYLVAAHDATTRIESIIIAIISGLNWFMIDFISQQTYTNPFIIYWNAAVRTFTFLIIALAFSKIKSKKKQVEEANKRLEAVSQEKNKYIGIAAHDIRNPLGNIYLLTNLLLNDKSRSTLNLQQIEFIQLINKVSNSALSLLNNILDIAQIEAGTLRLNKEKQDYIGYLQEVIQMNQHIALQKGQTIKLVTSQPSIMLSFDKTYMSQVLLNLLTNAIKFSYKDALIQVVVTLQQGQVLTQVIDKGVGIREEDKERIFQPFEKAKNLPTAGESSSGLGLAIVKKVVEAHDGTIGVESEYNKGTTFYFTLPSLQ